MSSKRLLDAKSGKNIVITGIVKTTEREKYLYYSKYPCMVSWSIVAVIRKEDRNKFTSNGKFSLYTNLNNTNNIFSYMKGIYYGKLLNIIKETNSKNHGVAAFDTIDQINLLLHNRIDFFFADPLVAYYTHQDDIKKSNIEFIECLELPVTPIYRYYATPKTKWGGVMIRKIDAILEGMICSGRLETLVKNWTPDNFKNKLEKAYQNDIRDKVLCD
ncbi:ABC transporter substrate-binding protein [Maridesulfovibrio ferrireducens]|uniref:substrate-binding periplasmic protein n=1 Tax=Maridesulfovibrio ferrireducens TaxID=246191 RepID=UPI001A2708F4|nr:transporter substrate-binding domain-containing protein [Maridesulfovibrio ferrireducens]MBI9111954.1 transporter substrate-binding domain-containing protein [Maridesulfovibrio ferrireducens]